MSIMQINIAKNYNKMLNKLMLVVFIYFFIFKLFNNIIIAKDLTNDNNSQNSFVLNDILSINNNDTDKINPINDTVSTKVYDIKTNNIKTEQKEIFNIFVTNQIIKVIARNITDKELVRIKSINCGCCLHDCYFTKKDIEFLKNSNIFIYLNIEKESYVKKILEQDFFNKKFSFEEDNLISLEKFNFDLNFYLSLDNILKITEYLGKIIPIEEEKYVNFINKVNLLKTEIAKLDLSNSLIYSENLISLKNNNKTITYSLNPINITKYKCVLIDQHYQKIRKYDNFIILPEFKNNIIEYLDNLKETLRKCSN